MAEIDNWITNELKELSLPDKRLKKRTEKILQDWSANATQAPTQIGEDWAATKAMYRILSNDRVESRVLRNAQSAATRARIKGYDKVLLLQDTTSVDLTSYKKTKGLGPLESTTHKGYFAHTTLATSPDGVPLGMVSQETWVRDKNTIGQSKKRRERAHKDKESYKWLKGFQTSTDILVDGVSYIVISDRESDVYEYIGCSRPPDVDLLLRVHVDRRLQGTNHKLWAHVAASPLLGEAEIAVPKRPNEPPRIARCTIRTARSTLKPPQRPSNQEKLRPCTINTIWLVELTPPDGVLPLEWMLITTLPTTSFDDAWQLIQFYRRRWLIERFHFVLKSGCQIEKRRLATFERHDRFLALANILAWRLLYLTYLARIEPDIPCDQFFLDYEWHALYCYVHKTRELPTQMPSLENMVYWIAKLGGFLARKNDGYPGVKVLWRGWQRLHDIASSYQLFQLDP